MLLYRGIQLTYKIKQDDEKYNESAALCCYRIITDICYLL